MSVFKFSLSTLLVCSLLSGCGDSSSSLVSDDSLIDETVVDDDETVVDDDETVVDDDETVVDDDETVKDVSDEDIANDTASSSYQYTQSYSLSLDLSGGGYSEAQIEGLVSTADAQSIYSEDEIITLLDEAVLAVKGDEVSFDNKLYESYLADNYTLLDGDSDSYYITEAGTYVLSGDINASVIVEVDDEDVRLVLNGVSITSDDGPAIVVIDADDVEVSVVNGTENYLEDATTRSDSATNYTSSDYTGALYSDCDLVLNGSGSLSVTANYNNGIITKDDLKIINLSLDVTSVDDGITGKDSVSIYHAQISIESDGDALKSTQDEDTEKGFVYIEGGRLEIDAGDDGIAAETLMAIYDGDFTIDALGKGIKSEADVLIGAGAFAIDSTDDALDANSDLIIYDGVYSLVSDSDTLKATEYLTVNGGRIDVTSYEGAEGQYVTINSGHLSMDTSDDSINASSDDTTNTLAINGGAIVATSYGDSIDVNGSAEITGGTVIVNGPTSNEGNSTFDVDDGYDIDAGIVFAMGNSMMVTTPSNSSGQNSIMLETDSFYSADTEVVLLDDSGNEIMSLSSVNSFDHVLFSHPDLSIGSSYTITFDASTVAEVTLSETVTDASADDTSGPGDRP